MPDILHRIAAASPDRPRAAQRGFTLLEVLVAFIIAALALAAMFRAAADSMSAVSLASVYQEALTRAQSHLATIGHGLALRPLHQSGDDGSGFHWDVDITLAATAEPARQPTDSTHGPAPRMVLYAVDVTESWAGPAHPRTLHLRTERLGVPLGPPP